MRHRWGGDGARLAAGLRWPAALAALLLGTAACAAGVADRPGSSAADGQDRVTVLAAASLTEPLTELARAYEEDHSGVDVALSFGSSTTLAQQVAAGAPADIVAFAGTNALTALPDDAAAGGGEATLARNMLEIATPPDNPGDVASLSDLGRRDLAVVLCASTVPCGAAADATLAKAGVRPNVVSREVDVKATLAKVRLGEADAAVVYHSDVVTAGDAVQGVEIPAARNATLAYPLLWLNKHEHTLGLVELLRSPEGVKALTGAGFLAP
jgi:molybdate transport system substrate-binding protein